MIIYWKSPRDVPKKLADEKRIVYVRLIADKNVNRRFSFRGSWPYLL